MEKLTRSELFQLIASKSNSEIIRRLFNDYKSVIQIFHDSSTFIYDFESALISDNYRESFDTLFERNIGKIENSDFRDFIIKKHIRFKKRSDSFYDNFNQLIRILARYHSKIIGKLYNVPKQGQTNIVKPCNVPQTFLSYAYDDKGTTLGLYLYFLNNNGFLYIDWMWHEKLSGPKIKQSVSNELNASSQFLFLRSPNSELLTTRGERMVRQWCSWEIGHYYNLRDNKKYYTNFYKSKKPSNDLLCDFSQAHYVCDGIIY